MINMEKVKFTKYKVKEGDVFNKLTVVKYLHHNTSKKSIWLFKCICGKEIEKQMDNVINNHTKSCGCYVHTEKITSENAPLKKIYRYYKTNSKKKNREFNLSLEEFKLITSKNCHYCNITPSQVSFNKSKAYSYTYNGIDRIDSSKGYEFDNIVTCCGDCNLMKRDMSYNDFLNKIKRISNYLNLKNNG